MIEYIYKGFKVSYKIVTPDLKKSPFKADGSLTYLLNVPKYFTPQKFYTEDETYAGAEHEIKKLLENYVNFELKNFYNMKKENKNRESREGFIERES